MSNRDIHEVEEPKGGDERAFKAKHKVKVTDHPEGTKLPLITTSKKKRLADPVDTEATYEEVETTFSIFWRDANGMDKQKHGLSEEEVSRLASALEAAGSVKIFIDEEKMTDAQMKKREKYVKGMKSKDDDLRKRYGKRWKDVMYAIATKNAMKEEAESLDEIAKSEDEPLHTQLRKRTNANEVSLTFKNGKTHVVSRGQANKALTMLSGMKPADRQHAHAEMSKSHEHFMDALEGKIAKPGKVGVSLAGPKMKSEEVEELDELKKPTLSSYIKKSADSLGMYAYGAGKTDDEKEKTKNFKTALKRTRGIKRASDRLAREEVEELDEVGGQTSQVSPTQPVSRPVVKPPAKKTTSTANTTVTEAGNIIPPKTPKMKSFSSGPNNYNLSKSRTDRIVPTQKDRSLEMDE